MSNQLVVDSVCKEPDDKELQRLIDSFGELGDDSRLPIQTRILYLGVEVALRKLMLLRSLQQRENDG